MGTGAMGEAEENGGSVRRQRRQVGIEKVKIWRKCQRLCRK